MILGWVATVQRWLLSMMLGCYLLAGAFPGPGIWLRGLTVGAVGQEHVTVPMVLLAVMLANAGLGVRATDLGGVLRRPFRLILGVVANALLPALVLPVVALALRPWHDVREVEGLLVGLLLVLAMPIAGGATAWGQNAGGNVPLVVTMVLGSTLLSPLTVPLGLRLTGYLVGPEGTGGLDDTSRLDGLAGTAVGTFALASVVLPCLAGIAVRALLSEHQVASLLPVVKAVNVVNILLLCYVNAAGALGHALSHPDPDLLTLALAAAGTVCTAGFFLGRWMSRLARCDSPDTVSLTFATGMNNSSAAAVLVTLGFPDRPQILLPILAYSLFQKALAGTVGRRSTGRPGSGPRRQPDRATVHTLDARPATRSVGTGRVVI